MKLPRILYISDVPVELSYAGATLMYRLLEEYPRDKLLIIQGMEVNATHRLSGVPYHLSESKYINRLLKSRFFRIGQWTDLFIKKFLLPRKYKKLIDGFKPDVVLTIPFRTSWLAASEISEQFKIPLHLIVHDDFLLSENYGSLQGYMEGQFSLVYKKAISRMCISPAMETYYSKRYNKEGSVLYPMRGKNDHNIEIASERSIDKKALCFCYAGSLNTGDFIYMLDDLAAVLGEMGARLIIYSNLDKETIQTFPNLSGDHISINGLVHPDELRKVMLEEVDVNILLNSFEHTESFKLNFSSKLVEYTLMPIPVLFWGSATSGTMAWAQANNYQLVSTVRNVDSLYPLMELIKEPDGKKRMGKAIQKLGEEYFGYEKNFQQFVSCIEV